MVIRISSLSLVTIGLSFLSLTGEASAQCKTWQQIWGGDGTSPAGTSPYAPDVLATWDVDGAGGDPELLVIAGVFASINGAASPGIALSDGVEWQTIGADLHAQPDSSVMVQTVLPEPGGLIVGGWFLDADNVSNTRNLAVWDGSSWSAFGPQLPRNAYVTAIARFDSVLYVGLSPSPDAYTLYRLVNNSWESVGGLQIPIATLTVYEDKLFIGSGELVNGSSPAPNHTHAYTEQMVVSFDGGSGWSNLNGGVGSVSYNDAKLITDAIVANGKYYIIGHIHDCNLDMTPIQSWGLAQWDDSNWDDLDRGFGSDFNATCVPTCVGSAEPIIPSDVALLDGDLVVCAPTAGVGVAGYTNPIIYTDAPVTPDTNNALVKWDGQWTPVTCEGPVAFKFVQFQGRYIVSTNGATSGAYYGVSMPGLAQYADTDSDFNNDTLFPDTADIDDFLAVFSGGPSVCSTGSGMCDTIDVNGDCLYPDGDDVDRFLDLWSGIGECAG